MTYGKSTRTQNITKREHRARRQRLRASAWCRSRRTPGRPDALRWQDQLMQYRTRDLLMRRLAQLINALRAHLSELGIAAAQRCAGIAPTSWPNDRLFAALHESVRGTFETCRAALNMSGYW